MRTLASHLSLPFLPREHRSQETNVLLISDKQLTKRLDLYQHRHLLSSLIPLGWSLVMLGLWLGFGFGTVLKLERKRGWCVSGYIVMCDNQHGVDGITDYEACLWGHDSWVVLNNQWRWSAVVWVGSSVSGGCSRGKQVDRFVGDGWGIKWATWYGGEV